MTMAFGGPNNYTGRSMEAAHERLIQDKGLGAEHFDAVTGHLMESLLQIGVAQSLVDEVFAVVWPLRVHFEPKAKVGAEADATTLYARLGGDAAVEATVDIFYNRVRNPMHATG